MEKNIEIAQSLFKQNKYQQTIDTCKKILADNNNSIEALKLISKSFLAIRKIEDARLYLNKSLNIKPDDYELIKEIGTTYQYARDFNTAKRYYKKAIEINSSYAPALTNLGVIELKTGKKEDALSLLIKATESDPQLAQAWGNLANGYVHLGKRQEAEIACRKSIELNSNIFSSHFLLGTILVEEKKLQEAIQPLRKAIELNPDFFPAHLNLGAVLKDLGQLKEAEVSIRKAIDLNPNLFNSHFLLGTILVEQKKLQEALQPLRKAIELNPDFVNGHLNLGNTLRNLGKIKEAELSTRKAIELNPDLAEAHSNLGIILKDIGKLQEAELSLNKAIEINPNFAEAYLNIGTILKELGKLQEAEVSNRKAIELNPNFAEAHVNLAKILLKKKKFKEGWIEDEWRWKIKNKKKLKTSKPEWNSDKKGRVLLWEEQGIGDILLFSSLIPDLINKVDKLIILIDKRLIPLFERSLNKNISFISKTDFIDERKYDFHIAMGSLPKYLRTSLNSFKTAKKLKLKANIKRSNNLRDKIMNGNHKKIIGISWKSSSKVSTLNLTLERMILGIYSPEIRFVCLQYGDVQEELNQLRKKHNIDIYKSDEVDLFNDIDGLAALIHACDEVVSIDNLTPILAGALEKKSDVLLPSNAYWAHGTDNCESYWYESMKYFRQNRNSNLNIVLKKIKDEIKIKNQQNINV